jgi:glutaconate CoA-transferase, subunit A
LLLSSVKEYNGGDYGLSRVKRRQSLKGELINIEEAIGLVRDGDLLTTGGLSFHRVPMELIREIIRQEKRGLRLVDREPAIGFDLLIGAGVASSVRFAMLGLELFGFALNFRKAAEDGKIEVIEDTCGALINGLRAASMGIPSMPVRGILGTDLLKIGIDKGIYKLGKDPFTGEDIVSVRAIEPDVALIHAQRADVYGNVQIWGGRFEDVWKAKAARKVIVSVEEIIDADTMKLEPYRITLPYPYVDAIVHLPGGAYPGSCYGLYDADYEHIREYVDMVRDGRFPEYLDKYVFAGGR